MSDRTCPYCGSAHRCHFRGGEGFECGTSIYDDGPAARGANCLVLTEVQPLKDLIEVLTRERDEALKKLASGIVTYERNGTTFHEARPSWPTPTEGSKP